MNHLALPHLRTASWARTAAVAVAVLLVCWLVVARSTSAFSGTTNNAGNTLTTGAVSLSDNDAGSAMFSATGLSPASPTLVKCIEVTYTGTVVGAALDPVKLYSTPTTTDLDQYLDLTIDRSAAGGSCGAFPTPGGFSSSATIFSPGTLQSFSAAHSLATNALNTTWTPSATNEKVAFLFTIALQDDNNAQNKTSTWSFTWQAQTATP